MNIKKTGFGITNILIYLFLTELISYIMGKLKFTTNFWILNFYALIPSIIVLIILLYINKDILKGKIIDIKQNKNKYFKLATKYYLCGLIAMIMATNIISLFTSPISKNEELNRQILKSFPIFAAISMVIIAPMSEEITFRGSFKDSCNKKILYLMITSFIFGFIHVISQGDYLNFLPYSALGFFLGKIYYETDNILVSTSIHAFHNFLCIMILTLGSTL